MASRSKQALWLDRRPGASARQEINLDFLVRHPGIRQDGRSDDLVIRGLKTPTSRQGSKKLWPRSGISS
jgi:hypothetical protein